ncbi:MAG: AI-2E family transporter [Bacteroidales bacterium]|jgi:AI-2 transport protein TqsA|nr:AI-2E family transporter [Bacteroidales bacterium]
MNYAKRIYSLLAIIIVVVLLIYAQSLLIPFVLALIIWFIIRILKKGLLRVPWIGKWPQWLLTVLSTVVLISMLGLVVTLISNNIQELSTSLPTYQDNIDIVSQKINETFDIDLTASITDFLKDFDFMGILSNLFSALTSIFGDAFLVIIYLVFILIEEPIFPKKIKAIYSHPEGLDHAIKLLDKIDHSTSSYMAIKSLMSLLTGTLSYFVLLFIGIDAPFFWAFLIFLLNYIPAIGSLIATLFPTIFAMLQFGDITHPILVLTIVGSIQVVIGNLLEPRVMGNNLNISTLVVFITLTVWGAIWGVIGMLLSVPVTVIMILILSEIPSTRGIAILLSKRGEPSK